MGATCSRSSPRTKTLLLNIREYSKLMQAPVQDHHRNWICFRLGLWEITVTSIRVNQEEREADLLSVAFFLSGQYSRKLAKGIDISIEILDKTGLYTVFQSESSQATVQEIPGVLFLQLRRTELEASLCVRHDDTFFLRCTLKEQRRLPGLLGSCWFSSKPEVFHMTRCHTLTVDSMSQIKSKLRLPNECVYSTRFTVGGNRWYLKLDPMLLVVCLVRATKEDDEPPATAEISFTLKGAVNVQSGKMTHTFDSAHPDCMFAYQPLLEEPPSEELLSEEPPSEEKTPSTDQLHVLCCVQVIPAVVLTVVPSPTPTTPAAAIRGAALPLREFELVAILHDI